jgi:hypothetical protein
METADEFATAQVRRFMTTFFVLRRRRLLKMLAEHYNWNAETLALYEERFIKTNECVPLLN